MAINLDEIVSTDGDSWRERGVVLGGVYVPIALVKEILSGSATKRIKTLLDMTPEQRAKQIADADVKREKAKAKAAKDKAKKGKDADVGDE